MAEEKTFKQKLFDRLEAWKGELEELKVQLSLGKKEAEDRYAETRAAFRTWVGENRERLNDLESEFGEEMEEIKARWQDLRHKLDEEQEETWEAFSTQRDKLNENLDTVREWLRQKAASGSERAKHLLDDLDNDIVKFRTRLDILALQMHLARMEAEEEIQTARRRTGETLDALKARVNEITDEAEKKWQIVRQELGQAVANIREAWKEEKENDA